MLIYIEQTCLLSDNLVIHIGEPNFWTLNPTWLLLVRKNHQPGPLMVAAGQQESPAIPLEWNPGQTIVYCDKPVVPHPEAAYAISLSGAIWKSD